MLEFALTLNQPVSIRYPRGEAYILGEPTSIELGKSEIISQGKDVSILALGSMVKTAIECVSMLSAAGISASLINPRFIKPLDETMLRDIAGNSSLVVTVEEGVLDCGFGSAIKEFYARSGLLDKINVVSAGLPDEFVPAGKRDFLLKMHGLDAQSLSVRIQKILKGNPVWQK
jgi:1-deoxy-D-xylulose-5-phosphate synthase